MTQFSSKNLLFFLKNATNLLLVTDLLIFLGFDALLFKQV